MAAWQIIVPIEATLRSPKSRIKIEFANVPAYETNHARKGHTRTRANPRRDPDGRKPNEILADKAVALIAREVLKFATSGTFGIYEQVRCEIDRS